jgi:hypothetical protein
MGHIFNRKIGNSFELTEINRKIGNSFELTEIIVTYEL